jgi:hypothetical protein
VHTQLHNAQSHGYFGDLMQYNTAMGERGLKVWAKRVSKTALKHGRDKFTYGTSSRVGKRMLLDTITDCLRAQEEPMASGSTLPSGIVKRRIPHFRFDRGSLNGLISLDHWGREHTADNRTGII